MDVQCAFLVLLVAACALAACDLQERLGGLSAACGETRLDDVMVQDAPSDACRAWLEEHALPDFEVPDKDIVIGGIGRRPDGELEVVLLGSGRTGEPLSDEDLDGADVRWHPDVEAAGEGTPVENPTRQPQFDGLVHVAFAVDYSQSMRDGELRAQAALMQALFRGLPGSRWGKVVFFSDSPDVRLPLTEARQTVEDALAHDPEALRGSTALWDAVGEAVYTLVESDALVRLLVISTDGKDNASVNFTLEDVRRLVDREGISLIIFASLLANRADLRRIADRNGFLVYGRNLEAAQDGMNTVLRGLTSFQSLRFPVPEEAGAISVQVGDARAVARTAAARVLP